MKGIINCMDKYFKHWKALAAFGLLLSLISPSTTAVFALGKPVHNIRSNTYYDTLHEALTDTNLADGDSIAIEGDVAETQYSAITKSVSIVAGNGSYTITGSAKTGQQDTNSLLVVEKGGSLTLGDGNTKNIITVTNSSAVVYCKGSMTLNNGAAVTSNSNYPIWTIGEDSSFVGKGGSSETKQSNGTGLRLDVGSSSTISGGTYTGDYAGAFVTGYINEISGGTFIGNDFGLLLQKNTGDGSEESATGLGKIEKISNGLFQGGSNGLVIMYRGSIDEISGGTFTNPESGTRSYASGLMLHSDNSYKTEPRINKISGGKFYGVSASNSPYTMGAWITQGNIDEISGGEFTGTVGIHLNSDTSAAIGTISNGIFSGAINGIVNGGNIDYITGGSFMGGTGSGVRNNSNAVMQTISGGYFEGGNYGFANAGTMTSITAGTFYGKKINAICLLGTDKVNVEPGLTDTHGYIDFRTNDNTSIEDDPIFTGEDLAVFPDGYHMSSNQRTGTNDLQYRYLTKYLLKYDTQGGDSIDEKIITDIDKTDLASGASATKAGSEFVKWQYIDASGVLKDYSSTMSYADIAKGNDSVVLYAVWKENTYTVQFDTDGGTGISDQSATYTTSDLAKNTETKRNGYTLTGWQYKDESGKLNDYVPTMSYKDIANGKDTVILYAAWQENTYIVHFDTNGGSEMDDQIFKYTASDLVKEVSAEKKGYTLAGWQYKDKNGNLADYDSHERLSDIISAESSSIKLYARWSANSYDIIFDNNTGFGFMENQKMIYDLEAAISKNQFMNPGYTFAGWSTKADGSGTHYANDEYIKNISDKANVVLYAQWQKISESDETYSVPNTATK
jgi:uncharacterized repeat protein (TIGR02543 family)